MTRLLRAELTKLFTTRTWWILLVCTVVFSALFAVLFGFTAGRSFGPPGSPPSPGLDDPAMVRSVYVAGITFAYLFALCIGVLAIGGEYRHQTISSTFLSAPRRLTIVLAKTAAVMLVGLIYGVGMVLGGFSAGAAVIAGRGAEVLVSTEDVPRSLALAVLAVALWALFGLGIGTLIKNQVAALMIAVGFAFIVEPLLTFLLASFDLNDVAQYTPSSATAAMVQTSTDTGGGVVLQFLDWWQGALVMIGYAAVFGILGGILSTRRDIT